MKDINEAEILKMFSEGFDCSQVVLSYFADELKIDKERALKISAAFGGGMWSGRTCGAVSGALMAIGLKYGHYKAGDVKTKNAMLEKKAEFEQKFLRLQKSCVCKEILGYDLSEKEGMEQIQNQNLLAVKCPKVVLDAITALRSVL